MHKIFTILTKRLTYSNTLCCKSGKILTIPSVGVVKSGKILTISSAGILEKKKSQQSKFKEMLKKVCAFMKGMEAI